ncbi:hypothetical protein P7C71_g4653, partial [Lecanoromycetidae sp. Uapishka_2]
MATVTPPSTTQVLDVRSAEEAWAHLSTRYSIAPSDATIIANDIYAYGLSAFISALSTTTSSPQIPAAPVPTTLANCNTQLTTIGTSKTAIGLLAATEVNLAAAISTFCEPKNPVTVTKAPSATYTREPVKVKEVVLQDSANWYLINVGYDDSVPCPTENGPLIIQEVKQNPPNTGSGYIGPQVAAPDADCVSALTQVANSCPGSLGASWESQCWRWEIQAWTGRDVPPPKMRRRGLVGEAEMEGM